MTRIGFSLSDFYFWPNRRLDFLLKKLSAAVPQATAIELSHFWTIVEFLKNQHYLKQYHFRTFHLPKQGYLKWINGLNNCQKILNLDYLILHPDVVKDWTEIKSKIPILIENMDKHKSKYQTIKEIKDLLKKFPQFKLCLDTNHVETQYPKQLADWLKTFKNKIASIHLSAINQGYYKKWLEDKKVFHSLCYFDRQILNNLPIKKYPIILEGTVPPNRWDLAKKEFDLVTNHLKK